MTVTSLLVGKLVTQPERRTGVSGKPFTTARMSAGTDEERVLVSVIGFSEVAEQLAALGKGETLALVGRTKLKTWMKDGEPRAGPDVVADAPITVYHLRKKRTGMSGTSAPTPEPSPGRQARAGGLGGAREQTPESSDSGPADAWLVGTQQ